VSITSGRVRNGCMMLQASALDVRAGAPAALKSTVFAKA